MLLDPYLPSPHSLITLSNLPPIRRWRYHPPLHCNRSHSGKARCSLLPDQVPRRGLARDHGLCRRARYHLPVSDGTAPACKAKKKKPLHALHPLHGHVAADTTLFARLSFRTRRRGSPHLPLHPLEPTQIMKIITSILKLIGSFPSFISHKSRLTLLTIITVITSTTKRLIPFVTLKHACLFHRLLISIPLKL